MNAEQRYYALQEELRYIEKRTGLYLADECVDAENAGVSRNDPSFFAQCYSAAMVAAELRAEEAGENFSDLIGRPN